MPTNFLNPWRLLGYWLLSFSMAILIVASWPLIKMEGLYQLNRFKQIHFVIEPKDIARLDPHFAELIRQGNLQIITPVDTNFALVIPTIGLNAKIFAEVDLANEEEYNKILTQGVAHALGSALPGQKGTIYLFAHSADLSFNYSEINALFYLLNKLKVGDEVNIFYNGWRYLYQVTEKNVVSPTSTGFLNNTGEERLVLQTCWPPGTRWQRLVLLAKPKYI